MKSRERDDVLPTMVRPATDSDIFMVNNTIAGHGNDPLALGWKSAASAAKRQQDGMQFDQEAHERQDNMITDNDATAYENLKNETEEEKKMRQTMANRKSAKKSRDRRKQRIVDLSATVDILTADNRSLQENNSLLTDGIQDMKQQLRRTLALVQQQQRQHGAGPRELINASLLLDTPIPATTTPYQRRTHQTMTSATKNKVEQKKTDNHFASANRSSGFFVPGNDPTPRCSAAGPSDTSNPASTPGNNDRIDTQDATEENGSKRSSEFFMGEAVAALMNDPAPPIYKNVPPLLDSSATTPSPDTNNDGTDAQLKEETEEEKKIRRIMANRKSAKESRLRRRKKMATLSSELDLLTAENRSLRISHSELSADIQAIKQQLRRVLARVVGSRQQQYGGLAQGEAAANRTNFPHHLAPAVYAQVQHVRQQQSPAFRHQTNPQFETVNLQDFDSALGSLLNSED